MQYTKTPNFTNTKKTPHGVNHEVFPNVDIPVYINVLKHRNFVSLIILTKVPATSSIVSSFRKLI